MTDSTTFYFGRQNKVMFELLHTKFRVARQLSQLDITSSRLTALNVLQSPHPISLEQLDFVYQLIKCGWVSFQNTAMSPCKIDPVGIRKMQCHNTFLLIGKSPAFNVVTQHWTPKFGQELLLQLMEASLSPLPHMRVCEFNSSQLLRWTPLVAKRGCISMPVRLQAWFVIMWCGYCIDRIYIVYWLKIGS